MSLCFITVTVMLVKQTSQIECTPADFSRLCAQIHQPGPGGQPWAGKVEFVSPTRPDSVVVCSFVGERNPTIG